MSEKKQDRRFASVQGREKTGWEVTDVWDIHHQITRRIFMGQKNKEIARALNITKEQVSSVRNSPVVQDQLKELHKRANENAVDVKKEINDMASIAVGVLKQLMENETTSDSVRASVAKDVLDRGGHQPPPQQHNVLHAHLTGSDLQHLKERARQAAIENGVVKDDSDVIDVTSE